MERLAIVLNLSNLTHRESLKRSLVGVGGLEVRERQCLALTLVRYFMVAHSKAVDVDGITVMEHTCPGLKPAVIVFGSMFRLFPADLYANP